MSASSPLPAVGIVGFGNMGEALAAGLLHKYAKTRVMILEQNAEAKAKDKAPTTEGPIIGL